MNNQLCTYLVEKNVRYRSVEGMTLYWVLVQFQLLELSQGWF